jgi:hypothetical protein
MAYAYIYTGDKKKEDRIRRIDKALKKLEEIGDEVIFAVNDLQSIAYLKEKGFKALNIDAALDLFNLLEPDSVVYLCTPEDTLVIKASFKNAKEICDEEV